MTSFTMLSSQLDRERLRLLGRVRVFRAGVYLELLVLATGQLVLRQHAPDRLFDQPLGVLLQHLLQVVFTARLGALDAWSLAKGYSCSLAASAVLGGAAALVSAGMLGRMCPLAAVAGAAILIAVAVVGIAMRRHLPPVKILARYRSGEVPPEP